jgi:ATP-dependent DNA helicase RecQ
MAFYLPPDRDAFGAISGVGATKLDQLADEFLPVIVEYSAEKGLSPRAHPTPRRGSTRRKSHGTSPGNSSSAKKSLSASLSETKRLFSENYSVDEIARERGLAVNTIFSHLEKIGQTDPTVDFSSIMPAPDRIETISAALRSHENGLLIPVKEELGDDYSYGEIRLVRMQMRRQFESSESAEFQY